MLIDCVEAGKKSQGSVDPSLFPSQVVVDPVIHYVVVDLRNKLFSEVSERSVHMDLEETHVMNMKLFCVILTSSTENHTEWLWWEGTSRGHLIQPLGSSRAICSQIEQDHVQTAFECLQEWRLHHLPGQLIPLLSHPDSEKVFPNVQTEPSVFQFVPIASCPVSGHP